jgi:3-oxoacyl-[acyl-carrier-protein] synthase II
MTAPASDGAGARESMRLAMKDAQLRPPDIDYINAHGTSTDLNDRLETLAIRQLLGEDAGRVAVSSIKSMTGHSLGAAGAFECAATAMTVHYGLIPPTINYETPDPECDLDYVPNRARRAAVRAALSNSFGFGGHNVCLAVTRDGKGPGEEGQGGL